MPSTTDFNSPQRTQRAQRKNIKKSLWSLCALWLIILAAACGGSGSGVIVPPTEEFGGPAYAAVVVTSDMAVGQERLVFGVLTRDGEPLRAEQATVRTYFLPPDSDERLARQTLTAEFLPWPTVAGVFVAHPEFDLAGSWELVAELTTPDGIDIVAKSAFPVKEISVTPAVGDPAPPSVTLKAADVEDLSHLTTSAEPDAGLYAVSVHEAVADSIPFVVLFATPAYCVSFTCGPQVQELSALRQEFEGRANFIHVEVFKDPHLIEGGRPTGGLVDSVKEWGLPTEPWTFVVDSQGIVQAKFEQYVPPSVVRGALLQVMPGN